MPPDEGQWYSGASPNVLIHLNASGDVTCYSVETRDDMGERLECRVVGLSQALPPAVALARALALLAEMPRQAPLWDLEPF